MVDLAVALSTKGFGGVAFAGLGIVGMIIFVLVLFLIERYGLDIIKYGIERRNDGSEIDLVRQIANAIKLLIVGFVYCIVPIIILLVLSIFLRSWLITIIGIILFIVFALANFMAKCRLAKTDSLGEALAIGEAIGDISRVGIGKLIITIILVVIILIVIVLVAALIMQFNNVLVLFY